MNETKNLPIKREIHVASASPNKYVELIKKILFFIIRAFLWLSTFISCIPDPLEWLKGIVIESGVDAEMCRYYYGGDAILFVRYIVDLIVWSYPFVSLRNIWHTLRVDILSLALAIFLLTSGYLIYVEYFT